MNNVKTIKAHYPEGTRIRLNFMDDIQAPPVGTFGTVRGVDSLGDILVDWDNGSKLKLIVGEDDFSVVKNEALSADKKKRLANFIDKADDEEEVKTYMNGLLNEDAPKRYSDVYTEEERAKGWWYFSKRPIVVGMIPTDLHVLDEYEDNTGYYVLLDGILNTSELNEYEFKEKSPQIEESKSTKEKKTLTESNEADKIIGSISHVTDINNIKLIKIDDDFESTTFAADIVCDLTDMSVNSISIPDKNTVNVHLDECTLCDVGDNYDFFSSASGEDDIKEDEFLAFFNDRNDIVFELHGWDGTLATKEYPAEDLAYHMHRPTKGAYELLGDIIIDSAYVTDSNIVSDIENDIEEVNNLEESHKRQLEEDAESDWLNPPEYPEEFVEPEGTVYDEFELFNLDIPVKAIDDEWWESDTYVQRELFNGSTQSLSEFWKDIENSKETYYIGTSQIGDSEPEDVYAKLNSEIEEIYYNIIDAIQDKLDMISRGETTGHISGTISFDTVVTVDDFATNSDVVTWMDSDTRVTLRNSNLHLQLA